MFFIDLIAYGWPKWGYLLLDLYNKNTILIFTSIKIQLLDSLANSLSDSLSDLLSDELRSKLSLIRFSIFILYLHSSKSV